MNEKLPTISIVLPTYNGARYIKKSIDSCLNQTYKNIELIIVDDCSTDETSEIVKSYKDARLIYLKHEENKGLPIALNTGFTYATGQYLTWTSDDNLYCKEAIEKMLSFLMENNCSFVFCDEYIFYDDNISELIVEIRPDIPLLKISNSIGACFMYSRQVKEVVGDYDPDTRLAEDYDYWIRISKKFTLYHLNEPLYYYRKHEQSLTSTRSKEVVVVDYLLKFKHNLLSKMKILRLFLGYVYRSKYATKYMLMPRKLCKVFIVIQYSRAIKKVLNDFQKEIISFKEAQSELNTIIGIN